MFFLQLPWFKNTLNCLNSSCNSPRCSTRPRGLRQVSSSLRFSKSSIADKWCVQPWEGWNLYWKMLKNISWSSKTIMMLALKRWGYLLSACSARNNDVCCTCYLNIFHMKHVNVLAHYQLNKNTCPFEAALIGSRWQVEWHVNGENHLTPWRCQQHSQLP